MKYDEWLDLLKRLEKTSHKEDIDKFLSEPLNENINYLLAPKIKDMIIEKFNNSINRIIKDLETIFSDENELDLALVTFKKDIKIIYSLINNNQLKSEDRNYLKSSIKEGIENAYNTLYESSLDADDNGTFSSIVNNNRIKWSDNNELSGD